MATTFQDPSKAVITSVGSAIGGGTANSVRPVIAGTAAVGTIVDVFDGVRMIGTALVASNGTWSFTPTADLKAGSHSFTAISVASNGDMGASSTPMSVTVPSGTPVAPPKPVIDGGGPTDDTGHPLPNPTNDPRPEMSGTGTPGDIITMYDGNTPIGSTVIDSTGHWHVKPAKDLDSGPHDIYVIETTPAGVPSQPSDHYPVVIDTTVPKAPVVTGLTDDHGIAIPNGSTTSDGHPTMNGTGAPGDIVKMYDGQNVVGSAKVDANGNWSITPTKDLSNGIHDLYAIETNAAGTSGQTSGHFVITVDTTVPQTPATPTMTDDSGATIPPGSTTSDAHPHINGTGTAGDVIKVYDNGTLIGSTTVGADSKWSFTPSKDLSNGAHSITVVDVNPAGTPSTASGAISVVIAFGPPAAPAAPTLTDDYANAIPAGSTTYDARPHINGTGKAGDIITVYDGSTVLGSTTVGSNAQWTFTPGNLSTGSHSINVTETNAAGMSVHSPSTPFSINPSLAFPLITSVVDSVGPIQGNIAQNGVTDDPRPVFHGTGVPGDVVKVADSGDIILGSVVVDASGQWTFQPATNLPNGLHSLIAAGKLVDNWSGTWNFTVDTIAPAQPAAPTLTDDAGATIPAGSTTNDTHPHINGTGNAGNIITVYDGSTVIGSTTVGGDGRWSFAPGNMSIGSHSINVTQTNAIGTSSVHSNATSVVISTAPMISSVTDWVGTPAAKGGTAVGTLVYTAYVDPSYNGATVAAYITCGSLNSVLIGYWPAQGGIPGSTPSVVANGMFTFTLSYNLFANSTAIPVSGTYSLSFRVTQPGGAGLSTLIDGSAWPVTTNLGNGASPVAPVLTDDHGAAIPAASTTSDAHPNISGHGRAGTTVKVFDNQILIGSATVGVDGTWTFKPSSDLSNGAHYISISQPAWDTRNIDLASAPVVITVAKVSATFDPTVHADDPSQAVLVGDTDQSAPQANHHTVVGEHDAFVGKLANGNETVDLNADPASYFKESTAHIQGAGGTAIDTLHLTGDHQVLDLTSLTGKTAAAKISGIEVVDLGGQHNTLKLSLIDVLNLGETDLFQKDGKQQMMVQGKDGDTVDLSNAHIAGLADGEWAAHGTAVVGGVTYNVYEHSGAHTELLVQQGVQIIVH